MLGRTRAVALVGLVGHLVDVESHLAPSLPAFTLVGLPDASLAEARDRGARRRDVVGLAWPTRRITVNLSPATLPKTGSSFDLAVAVATLAGAGLAEPSSVAGWVHLGELGLDGRLRPVRGVLPSVAAAVAAGASADRGPAGGTRRRHASSRGRTCWPRTASGRSPRITVPTSRCRTSSPYGTSSRRSRCAPLRTWRTCWGRTRRGTGWRSRPPVGTTC
ncbi:magnesium chelatase domain-containing protein [Cellulomonas phragmiteti]|uniref:magnesium chelatase domain-containing protein n=1 Tax=Cellulomonas phragmiteti TaxID=478780 RepID=UPI00363BEEC4